MAVSVDVVREGARLSVRYRLTGALNHIAVPAPSRPERADGLWRHTCFEAFIRPGDSAAYCEFNFSPSTQWAAYRFTGYREGMAALDIPAPEIVRSVDPSGFEVDAMVDLSGIGDMARAPWRVAVTAVIEDALGGLSYWAPAHAPGKPDFHHADCFVLDLPAEAS